MARRRRGERPLRRRAPQIDELARFVIFCEGELTEPLYLNAFAALEEVRSVATLDIRGLGCEPRKLVEEARAAKRSERGQSTGVTKYWCVFDVEAPTPHARLHEAVQMARDNDTALLFHVDRVYKGEAGPLIEVRTHAQESAPTSSSPMWLMRRAAQALSSPCWRMPGKRRSI